MLSALPGDGAEHDRLRMAVDALPLAVFVRDREGRIGLANAACGELWGVSEAGLLGSDWTALMRADEVARLHEVDRHVLAEGCERDTVCWLAAAPPRRVCVRLRPLRAEGGAVVGTVGVAWDVTDAYPPELAQRARDVRLDGVVESALDGIITCDAHGRVRIFNAAAEAMFGIPRAEILGQPLEQLIPASFRPQHGAWMREFGASRTPHRRIRSPGQVHALRANGEQFPVEASISHVEVDGESLYTVVLRDITEREQHRAALQASQQAVINLSRRLELAVKGSGFGVWEFDLTAGRLIWDAQMYRVYGHDPESFDGSPEAWKACLHPEDRALVDQRFNDLLSGCPVALFVFRIHRHDDGALRHIEANGCMQPDADGRPQRLVGMNRDVTERVLADAAVRELNHALEARVLERTRQLQDAKERADEASRAKSVFLANMSHELRTPLHSILGFVKLVIEDQDSLSPAQRLRFLERVQHSGTVLLDLVNDLLDSAKIEARRLEITRLPIDLAAQLRTVLDEQQVAIAAKRLQLAGDRRDQATIRGDAGRIQQALRNVLANAVRFSPEGGRLGVDLLRSAGSWRVIVEDEGPGIPVDERERIFECFTQSSLTASSGGGTGLGLPITRGIVELHDGRVWAETGSAGQGARFVIELPASLE